jgi:hypothetical protein
MSTCKAIGGPPRSRAAGTVAGDDQRHVVVAGDVGEVGGDPPERGPTVLDRGGVAVLRCQPVVDEDHGARRPLGELAGHRVELVDGADDPAAAVQVDDDAAGALWRDEDADGDSVPVVRNDSRVIGPRHTRRRAGHLGERCTERPRLFRRAFVQWLPAAAGELFEHRPRRMIQCHTKPPAPYWARTYR